MPLLITIGGAASLAALVALAVSQAPLGSPLFFALIAVLAAVYALLVARLLSPRGPQPPFGADRLLILAVLFAVAFRVPLAVRNVGGDSDMIRYLYDGRVQRLGYNPFVILPSDPALAETHTDDTRRMPSLNARTPYPAAAQLFFRLVVTVHESTRAMKLALIACDLATMAVLFAWLRSSSQSPWLLLVYAWNPLVILEVAHSGHVDALGALWMAVSAWMLSTRRGAAAAVAFVLAVATKLVPIVLLPLYWGRLRFRDAFLGVAVLLLLYLPFASAGTLPLGTVPNVIAHIRFNGPLFLGIAALIGPQGAAAVAVLAGFAVAAWMRWRRPVDDPAAWAWPMAVALAAAPVIYPWYLLYLTPFLFTRRAVPLIAWTISALSIYVVWDLARHGHRWFVPPPLLWLEYGSVVAAGVMMLRGFRNRQLSA